MIARRFTDEFMLAIVNDKSLPNDGNGALVASQLRIVIDKSEVPGNVNVRLAAGHEGKDWWVSEPFELGTDGSTLTLVPIADLLKVRFSRD